MFHARPWLNREDSAKIQDEQDRLSLFPGQGAQTVGMGRELYEEVPAARELFDRAGEILGFDLKAVCFDGPSEALEATDVSQPAIYVASLAALEGFKLTNPEVVAPAKGPPA